MRRIMQAFVLIGLLGMVGSAAAQTETTIVGGMIQLDAFYVRANRLFEPGPVTLALGSIIDNWVPMGVHVYALQGIPPAPGPVPPFAAWFLVWNLGVYSITMGEPLNVRYLWVGPFFTPAACAVEKANWQMYHNGPLLVVQPVCLGVMTWP